MSNKKESKTAMSDFRQLVNQVKESETFDKEVVRGLVSDMIDLLMKKEGVSNAELARRLGKSRQYVTKILQGNANFTLESLVQIARALGDYKFQPLFVPQEMTWVPAIEEIHLRARVSVPAASITVDNGEFVEVPLSKEENGPDEERTDRVVG